MGDQASPVIKKTIISSPLTNSQNNSTLVSSTGMAQVLLCFNCVNVDR